MDPGLCHAMHSVHLSSWCAIFFATFIIAHIRPLILSIGQGAILIIAHTKPVLIRVQLHAIVIALSRKVILPPCDETQTNETNVTMN
jgi:hypothetical protein